MTIDTHNPYDYDPQSVSSFLGFASLFFSLAAKTVEGYLSLHNAPDINSLTENLAFVRAKAKELYDISTSSATDTEKQDLAQKVFVGSLRAILKNACGLATFCKVAAEWDPLPENQELGENMVAVSHMATKFLLVLAEYIADAPKTAKSIGTAGSGFRATVSSDNPPFKYLASFVSRTDYIKTLDKERLEAVLASDSSALGTDGTPKYSRLGFTTVDSIYEQGGNMHMRTWMIAHYTDFLNVFFAHLYERMETKPNRERGGEIQR